MAGQSRKPASRVRRLVQLTLDFFAPEPGGAAARPDAEPQPGLLPIDASYSASEAPAAPVLPAAASFRHPQATHEIVLDGKQVAYEMKRRKRRTIGFSVGLEGLAVSAPKWVSQAEIERAVSGKAGWIVGKLHEMHARHRQLDAARIHWKDGAAFPFLGEPVRLVLDSRQGHDTLEAEPARIGSARVLRLQLPANATSLQIQTRVQSWIRQQAVVVFTARLDHFAPQLQVQWRKLSLSSAATRWGSASSSGSIRLNWRLLHLNPALIDYVVVHELSHLRVMDHSPRFWATVHSVMPGHAALRRQLKAEVVPRW
jgi:predicted metal-dependent hydrolase